jgi:hypothetical protein
MKWIREREALIAQTMAFVQSVTGRKDGSHRLEIPTAAPAEWTEAARVESGTVETFAVEIEPPEPAPPHPAAAVSPPRTLILPPRASSDIRSEVLARVANFRKHQERFKREREDYCAATLTRLRDAIRDAAPRPPAGK